MNKPRGKEEWELYNLDHDPAEMNDKAQDEPEVVKKLVDQWERYYAETGMVQTPVFGFTTI